MAMSFRVLTCAEAGGAAAALMHKLSPLRCGIKAAADSGAPRHGTGLLEPGPRPGIAPLARAAALRVIRPGVLITPPRRRSLRLALHRPGLALDGLCLGLGLLPLGRPRCALMRERKA